MRRDLAVLFVVALLVRGAAAAIVAVPPHLDAAYYTMVADQLASGNGFSAPALWSFLEVGGRLPVDAALPVASNAHWMPMTSIVAAAGVIVGGDAWRGGQAVMVLLSALLVPLTYLVASWLFERRRVAVIAALLALAGGTLLVMYPLVESFAVFGLLGSAALLASMRATESSTPGRWLVVAGLAVGLATITRIDGVLLAVAPATAWLAVVRRRPPDFGSPGGAIGWGAASAAAFALPVVPWLARNVAAFGSPLPSTGGRLLWLRDFNEQFSISTVPDLDRYLAWGIPAILGSKLLAAGLVLAITLGLFGGLFAVSFAYGLWWRRHDARFHPYLAYVAVMGASMVLLFTEHAPKGAFVHSAPAWMPVGLPLAVAAVGPLADRLGAGWRFLRRPATHRFLEVTGMLGAVILSVVGGASLLGQWDVREQRTAAAAEFLRSASGEADVVMAADAPGLWLASGRAGVAMPFDPYPVVADVIDAYQVRWVVVILDPGTAVDPLGLWRGEAATDVNGDPATFLGELAFEAEGVRIFEVRESGG